MLMMKITCTYIHTYIHFIEAPFPGLFSHNMVNMHDVMCCDGSQELMFKKILNDSLMIAEPNVN